MYGQMTALLQDSEQMVPTQDVYLVLLTQMFMTWTVLMEQYSQLQTHIHGSELLTQSEAAAAIFLHSTTGEASDKEAMSCDDEVSVMPPAVLKPSGSGQTLQGATLHQVLARQPPPSLLPLQKTPKTPASSGQTLVLEKLFREVPSWWSWTTVPMPCTQTHSTESHKSRGSTGSKQKVHSSGGANVEPPEKQQHHSCSDDTVFIMMDSVAAAAPEPVAEEPPTLSLEKVAVSSSQGQPTHSVAGHSHSGGSASS